MICHEGAKMRKTSITIFLLVLTQALFGCSGLMMTPSEICQTGYVDTEGNCCEEVCDLDCDEYVVGSCGCECSSDSYQEDEINLDGNPVLVG